MRRKLNVNFKKGVPLDLSSLKYKDYFFIANGKVFDLTIDYCTDYSYTLFIREKGQAKFSKPSISHVTHLKPFTSWNGEETLEFTLITKELKVFK